MAATFDPGLSSKRDEARLWLGDYHQGTVAGAVPSALLQDATIDAKLAAYPFNEAVAQLAGALISKYANSPDSYDEGGTGLKLVWAHRLDAWKTVIKEARATMTNPTQGYRPGIRVAPITNPNTVNYPSSKAKFRSN